MARRTPISKELKDAIEELSHREKDKLLFRLLPKDPALVAKLEYQLLEGGDTMLERREELVARIKQFAADSAVGGFYSPGYLLLDFRSMSGQITQHVKTTKDKEAEIKLNVLMLREILPPLVDKISGFPRAKARTLNNYVIQRSRKILRLLNKLHPDLQMDYHEDLRTIGQAIGSIDSMMRTAIHEGFDVNWLLRGAWPEDI